MIKRQLLRICAMAAVVACGDMAVAKDKTGFEGRWIKECGQGKYCRLLIEKNGVGYKLIYMITDPANSGAGGSCEWTARMRLEPKQGRLKPESGSADYAFTMSGDRLTLKGQPPGICGRRKTPETFDRDEADEFGDI